MNRTRKELFLPTSGRILRGRRTLLSHGVELCLLFVTQRRIEGAKCRTHFAAERIFELA